MSNQQLCLMVARAWDKRLRSFVTLMTTTADCCYIELPEMPGKPVEGFLAVTLADLVRQVNAWRNTDIQVSEVERLLVLL